MPAHSPPLCSSRRGLVAGLLAVACFHLAYNVPALGVLIFGYVFGLVTLAGLPRVLHVFVASLLTALLCVAPQLAFFYGIFGPPAFTLWIILAAWTATFVTGLRLARGRLSPWQTVLLAPSLWTALEFFRSEMYPLRFSWLNVGYALGPSTRFLPMRLLGVYGLGFLAVVWAAILVSLRRRRIPVVLAGIAMVLAASLLNRSAPVPAKDLLVAGIQAENPSPAAVLENLDTLARSFPDAPLYVMSEYTFDGPVPGVVLAWCRSHGKYLIAGGKQAAPPDHYYNTAFVIDPAGVVIFQQAKSVPIQFFDDGLPAPNQALWLSPWGKIGLCICYDLSYRQVTDRLIAQGAQALIVPTMDAWTWGEHEHRLHTRVALVRAAEYGIPVFRVASSGISQAVDSDGRETARAPFPGDAATLSARLRFGPPGTLPFDRFLVPLSLGVTLVYGSYLLATLLRSFVLRRVSRRIPGSDESR